MLRTIFTMMLLSGVSLSQATTTDSGTSNASLDVVVLSTVVAGISSNDGNHSHQSVAHVRALFAMDDSDIRNVYPELAELKAVGDYVVNCSDQSLAITEFRVLKPSEALPASTRSVADEKLSFSAPKFDSEIKVVRAACGSSVASLDSNLR
jgi:hypothetical protein